MPPGSAAAVKAWEGGSRRQAALGSPHRPCITVACAGALGVCCMQSYVIVKAPPPRPGCARGRKILGQIVKGSGRVGRSAMVVSHTYVE